MDYVLAATTVILTYTLYHLATISSTPESLKTISVQDNLKTHFTHPKLPWHLTSHLVTDKNCMCQYVYYKLLEEGLSPDMMNGDEATEAYYLLEKKHPDYARLLVG